MNEKWEGAQYRRVGGEQRIVIRSDATGPALDLTVMQAIEFHGQLGDTTEFHEELGAVIEEAITAGYASEDAVSRGRALFAGAPL